MTTNWRPMKSAPTDGTRIMAIGKRPGDCPNICEDVRIIEAWKIGDTVGWHQINGFSGGFTVGFNPRGWLPMVGKPKGWVHRPRKKVAAK